MIGRSSCGRQEQRHCRASTAEFSSPCMWNLKRFFRDLLVISSTVSFTRRLRRLVTSGAVLTSNRLGPHASTLSNKFHLCVAETRETVGGFAIRLRKTSI